MKKRKKIELSPDEKIDKSMKKINVLVIISIVITTISFLILVYSIYPEFFNSLLGL